VQGGAGAEEGVVGAEGAAGNLVSGSR
jgi:hypothetical protein